MRKALAVAIASFATLVNTEGLGGGSRCQRLLIGDCYGFVY